MVYKGKSSVYSTVVSRRTIRRFKQKEIAKSTIKRLINAARLAPSAANLQPLEYIIIAGKDTCSRIFPYLRWAAYIAPRGTPPSDKRPVAYIAVLVNTRKAQTKYASYDVGAAVQNILLTAWELGIGCCWMQAIDRLKIKGILNLSAGLKLDSIIALGYRAESPVAEDYLDSIKYWQDRKGTLHVPKRTIKQILCKEM